MRDWINNIENKARLSLAVFVALLLALFSIFPNSAAAADVTATTITVYWTAPGDDGTVGSADLYEVRYSTSPILEVNWASATVSSNPPDPSVAGSAEQHTVAGLTPGVTYYVAVKARDESGNWSQLSNVVSATTDISLDADDDDAILPNEFDLAQNFPNPFNPVTNIEFNLPRSGFVELSIYNITGRKVRTLEAADLAAGSYTVEWDGRDERGHAMASGVYFYRLKAADFVATRKMTLLK